MSMSTSSDEQLHQMKLKLEREIQLKKSVSFEKRLKNLRQFIIF